MSGPISEDTVWEQGKDYVVVGDVVVEENSVLTIEPDVRIFVKADTKEDYCGLIVKGRLLADGGDSLHAIRFAPVRWSVQGDVDLWRVPGSWKGVWFEPSADSSSVVRQVRIEYAQVGIKGNRCGLRVEQVEVIHCADTGILFYGSDWGEVSGCTVRENKNGIRFELVEDGVIARCVVQDHEENGMECKTSSPDIEDNLIEGNGWGIYCWYGASPAISLGYFARELGVNIRDLYAALEERGLPASNIGVRPPAAGA